MSNDILNSSSAQTPDREDIHARVDALTAALHEAQREIAALRRQRSRPSVLAAAVTLSFATGALGLNLAAQGPSLQSGRFSTPFEIFGDDGRTILRIEDVGARPSISIGRLNAGGISFGVDQAGVGFLAVRGADGTHSSVIDSKGIRIMGADGNAAAVVLGFDNAGKQPLLKLGGDTTGGIDAGTDASGLGFLVVRTGKGQPGISLGQRDQAPLGVTVHDASGTASVAQLGADGAGGGRVRVRGEIAALDAKQVVRAALTGTGGVVVNDPSGEQSASMTGGDGNGARIAIWRSRNRIVDITSEPAEGSGILSVNSGSGQSVIQLSTVDGAGQLLVSSTGGARLGRLGATGGAGSLSVMNPAGRAVAGLLGNAAGGGAVAVATSNGATVADISVAGDGRGLFQVYARGGGRPLAVMTQSLDGVAGLFQVSNATTSVANLTAGSRGGGYLQLSDPGGTPTVEAGTLPNGNGQVRAGPVYKCSPVQAATPVLSIGLPDCIVGGKK